MKNIRQHNLHSPIAIKTLAARKWDTLCAFLLVLVAILTPFEAGFLEGDLFSWMGIFNIITNLFFLIDMLMQFFIAYPIETRYGPRWILQRLGRDPNRAVLG